MNRSNRTGILLFFAVFALGACAPKTEQAAPEPESYTQVEADDPIVREAIADAEGRVSSAPKDPSAWLALGRTLQANGYFSEAVPIYDRVIDLQPGHRMATYLKAVAIHRERPTEAIETLDGLSKVGATDGVMERVLAEWSLEVGDLALAEAAANRSISANPAAHGPRAVLARVLIESGRFAAAIDELEELVRRPAHHPYLDFLYATALMAEGRREEAESVMPALAPDPPRWPNLHLEALADLSAGFPAEMRETREWMNAGDLERALPRAERLHQNHPESISAAILHALCLRDSGQFDAAIDLLKTELDRHPRSPELLYQTAAAMTMSAQYRKSPADLPEALDLVKAALEVDPNRYQSHGVAGAILQWMGRREEALGAFKRCAAIDPVGPAQCPTKVGNLLIQLGRTEEGLGVLSDAVERQPLEPAPTVTYAVHLRDAGKQVELEELLAGLEAGGSAFAELRTLVDQMLASGQSIKSTQIQE